jgi:2-hydroxy-6-oxonona-2,4-dienedioate hydrolase
MRELNLTAATPPVDYRSIWTYLQGVPLTQGYVDVAGVRTRYLRTGESSRDKVILLPGTGGNAETYCANIGVLGAHFDCWAVDPVGFGHSTRPNVVYDTFAVARHIIGFCEQIGAEQVYLVGCSVGAWSCLRIALNRPDLVRGIIMISPLGGPRAQAGQPFWDFWAEKEPSTESPDGESARMREGALLRKQAAAHPNWARATEIMESLLRHPDNRIPDMIASRLIVNQQPGAAENIDHVLWWTDRALRARNGLTREELESVSQPVLGFIDETQGLYGMARAMFEALPNGTLVTSTGCGHWNHFEDAPQFNDLAVKFLSGGHIET